MYDVYTRVRILYGFCDRAARRETEKRCVPIYIFNGNSIQYRIHTLKQAPAVLYLYESIQYDIYTYNIVIARLVWGIYALT